MGGHTSPNKAGVSCVAVHPSGKLALSGGRADGSIRVWDLMRGRLAHVHTVTKGRSIDHLIWSKDGSRFAFCHKTHLTVRDVATGQDLLDVELESTINGVAFIGQFDAPEGLFLAVVCENGSLCVFCVGELDDEAGVVRGIEAIQGVDRLVVADDRFKCLRGLDDAQGCLVVTANTGGVVSVINLEAAVRMLVSDENNDTEANEDEDEDELTADILTSVRVGSGARITSLAVWSRPVGHDVDQEDEVDTAIDTKEIDIESDSSEAPQKPMSKKQEKQTNKRKPDQTELETMDEDELAKARKLVQQAKKRQKRIQEKNNK